MGPTRRVSFRDTPVDDFAEHCSDSCGSACSLVHPQSVFPDLYWKSAQHDPSQDILA